MSVFIMAFAGCGAVACVALLAGSAVVVRGVRMAPRSVEERLETRGVVTVPVQHVVADGRVDVIVERRGLGLLRWRRVHLKDVTDITLVSGSTRVRAAPGRSSSGQGTRALLLTMRDGRTWTTPSASSVFGDRPDVVAEGLRQFVAEEGARDKAWRWMPLFENLIGLPFLLIAGLILLSIVRVTLVARAGTALP